jgi:hypothetical protein
LTFCFGLAKLRACRAEMFFDDALDHRFESFEESRERQAVAFEHAAGVTLDHRQTRTRQDRRRRSFEHAIDLGGLREVSDLRGAAVVSDRRQQVILDHGAQRTIRTNRSGLGPARRARRGVLLLASFVSTFHFRPDQRVSRACSSCRNSGNEFAVASTCA